MEWIPSEEEYNPGITKEQWIEFVQDKNIFNENALITFACIQKAKVSSCGDMAEEFGRSLNFYNSNVWRTGERIFKKTNCPLSEREEGNDRFWSICCLGKYEKQPDGHSRFIYKIRPELQEAFDETGVLEGVKVMEGKISFTWIPFYQEMAEKLLKYKDNRKELVKIVYGMDRQFVNYIRDDDGNDYPDIDPFSVFAIFNRKITDERRKEICQYFRNVFQLESDIPKDFDSIPVMNPQLSVFVWKGDISTGIQPIWDLYETVFENYFDNEKFSNHFNIVRNQKGIKWTLTMALYWIRPYEFMPLDSPSREYLQRIRINVFDEKDLNGQNYLDLCKVIKEKIENNGIKEKSIPEISYNAWLRDPQGDTQMEVQYWLIAPGENARKWDEYSKNGEIGIGWEELGNIEKYDSDYESFQNDYIKTYKSENDNYRGSSPKQIWDFYKNISIGDIIFARNGVRQIIGMGKVTSNYKYDDSRDEYKHLRKVEWEKIGEWDYPGQSSRDTVHKLRQEQAEEILKAMNSQITDYEKKLDEIKNNLLVNRNVILTGAPGTGKTFMAKTVAARLILDREINDYDKDLTEEEKKQVKSQTDFVQFHPSYDYTDFVEGLRPKQVDGSEQIGFERKDGVFKAFCEKALKESYRENNDNVDNFEECWKKLVDELNENDFVTIPLISGKGEFRVELNEYGTGLANRTYENDDYQKGKWIQGKSKFFSKDQLYNIYQGLPGTPAGGHDNYRKAVVEYMKKNLGLLDYIKTETTQKTKKNFVFIIDEINRGEVAKIFGELFFCVDPGYRGEKGIINTQYQNLVTSGEFQKGFFIPENVYIIGTMNDIDRSVESMDFAFRRRFSWIEVKASDTVDMLDSELSAELAKDAKKRMIRLNKAIWDEKEKKGIEGLNEAYHIGASYFLKLKNYGGDFESLWNYHIRGILQEYLRGNPNGKLDDLKAAYDEE